MVQKTSCGNNKILNGVITVINNEQRLKETLSFVAKLECSSKILII